MMKMILHQKQKGYFTTIVKDFMMVFLSDDLDSAIVQILDSNTVVRVISFINFLMATQQSNGCNPVKKAGTVMMEYMVRKGGQNHLNSSKILFARFQKWQPLRSNREMKNEER